MNDCRCYHPTALWLAVFLLSVLLFSTSGCSQQPGGMASPTPFGVVPIDPDLRDFYRSMGENLLGPAIAPVQLVNGYRCQYTSNLMLCVIPNPDGKAQIVLARLGTLLELPILTESQPIPVFEDFIPVYQKLNGSELVGQPLSGIIYNYEYQRVEQYFECAAFYHGFNEAPGQVNLLPLGSYECGSNCTYDPGAKMDLPRYSPAPEFILPMAQLGWNIAAGEPLTESYISADGSYIEQKFENLYIYAPVDDPQNIRFRNLVFYLNMPTSEPVYKQYDLEDGVVFYPTMGVMGYHVPIKFDEFIATHGGIELSGQPTGETFLPSDGDAPRQCFNAYCLDYYTVPDERFVVRLAPIGIMAYEMQYVAAIGELNLSPDTVTLQVSEDQPQVSSSKQQIIRIMVVQREDKSPINGVNAVIHIKVPDGRSFDYDMPATDANGRSSQTIPPILGIPNGTVISYKVCLVDSTETDICINDSYLVWN